MSLACLTVKTSPSLIAGGPLFTLVPLPGAILPELLVSQLPLPNWQSLAMALRAFDKTACASLRSFRPARFSAVLESVPVGAFVYPYTPVANAPYRYRPYFAVLRILLESSF